MRDTTEFDKATTSAPKQTKDNVVTDNPNVMLDLEKKQQNLLKTYEQQEKHTVRVAPAYAKYFGKIMRVSINGISVTIPCDGQSYPLPLTFATEVERRMAAMDAYEKKQSRMSNIKNNFEASPGQLTF